MPLVEARSHTVQFYEAHDALLPGLTRFVLEGLDAGDTVILYATPDHRDRLDVSLIAAGVDLEDARTTGRYLAFDAAETLAAFAPSGVPDPALFAKVVGAAVEQAANSGAVRAFGEMVALLVADGHPEGAFHLEELWNALQDEHEFALLCAYEMDLLDNEGVFDRVCSMHSAVVPAERYLDLSDAARSRHVAALQQRIRLLEREVTALRQEAVAALAVRDEFLMTAAHELRTPLTSVLASLQILERRVQQAPLQREQAGEVIRMAADGARKLSRIVRQLLDASRLSSGRIRLDVERVDVAGMVREVVTDMARTQAKHTLRLDAPESLVVNGDPLRVEQVLVSLLDNAVRFSPEGGVVEVSLRATEHGSEQIAELIVRDQGPGIAPAARGHIFERFFQAAPDTRGLGLGLHVSRQLVEAHGGTIEADFPADGGMRVIVRLPMPASA